ncbi:HK97 gp10 family phage protein [Acidipropionibacterium timonense]|uniref:HK97 gp10 family phage protein n=1 Tax=Acidipropionibacterium timonense TaxID=2161818 RepID=UPI0010315BC1|nr:HK97 gp10 family phage protein [Acidipropionibacterium timonense]
MIADLDLDTNGVRLTVTGLSRTIKRLEKAGAAAQDMRDLMHEVGTIVLAAAQPRAPRRSGRLARTGRAGHGKTKAVVRYGGARAPYAGVIHYGWPDHHIRGRHWVDAALAATRPQQLATLERGITRILKQADLI